MRNKLQDWPSAPAHTEGNWRFEERFDGKESLGIDVLASNGRSICHIAGNGREDFANAALLAAAPMLLHHLRKLLLAINRLPGNNPVAGLADEAAANIEAALREI